MLHRLLMLTMAGCVCLSGLSGCASGPTQNPSPLPDNPGLVEIDRDWYTYAGFGPSYSDYRWRPALDSNKLYVIAKQGAIFALDKQSGSRDTLAELGDKLIGGAGLEGGLLLLGTMEGELLAFDPEKRQLAWRTKLGSEVLHPPVSDGRLVAVKTNDGKLWGIELQTGLVSWTAITKNPPLTTRAQSEPVFAGGVIFATFDTGKLAVISPLNGARVWEAPISIGTSNNEIQRLIDADARPVIQPPAMFAANLHGSLQSYLLLPNQAPTLDWSIPFSTDHNFIATDGKLFLLDEHDSLVAVSQQDGAELWRYDALAYRGLNEPLLWNNKLWVADHQGYVFCFDLQGRLLGHIRVSPYAVESSMVADEERLYLQDNGGYVSALRIR